MEYNFRDKEKIQFSEYCCISCLTDDILGAFETVGVSENMTVYAKANVITELIRELLSSQYDGENFKLGMITFDGLECDYVGEYVLTISDDLSVWVQRAFYDNGNFAFGGDKFAFVSGDCDSRVIQELEKRKVRTMIFDFMEDDEDFGDESEDEFEEDEVVDLYDLVESMVEHILDERYGRFNQR